MNLFIIVVLDDFYLFCWIVPSVLHQLSSNAPYHDYIRIFTQVLAAPDVHTFAEILALPNVGDVCLAQQSQY